jgi:hypothetical protein
VREQHHDLLPLAPGGQVGVGQRQVASEIAGTIDPFRTLGDPSLPLMELAVSPLTFCARMSLEVLRTERR